MKKLMMAVGAVMVAGAALAATSFAYQGVLRNERGEVSGLKAATIDFKLYMSPTGADPAWGRTVAVQLGTNGLFNVELSDTAGLAVEGLETVKLDDVIEASEKAGQPLYIGLTVQGSAGEIRPRQKVIPVPMASYAQNVGAAKGNFTVAGDVTVGGNLSLSGDKSEIVASKATIAKFEATGESDFKGGLKVSGGTMEVGTDVSITGKLQANGVDVGVPIGCIVMWSGMTTAIPAGWGLCDGTTYEGTVSPDLRGRFIVGMNDDCVVGDKEHQKYEALSAYKRGATGGAEKITLTAKQVAAHNHQFPADDSLRGFKSDQVFSAAQRDVYGYGEGPITRKNDKGETQTVIYDCDSHSPNEVRWTNGYQENQRVQLAYTGKNNVTGETVNTTEGHDNLPPYFALCFIIKYK